MCKVAYPGWHNQILVLYAECASPIPLKQYDDNTYSGDWWWFNSEVFRAIKASGIWREGRGFCLEYLTFPFIIKSPLKKELAYNDTIFFLYFFHQNFNYYFPSHPFAYILTSHFFDFKKINSLNVTKQKWVKHEAIDTFKEGERQYVSNWSEN